MAEFLFYEHVNDSVISGPQPEPAIAPWEVAAIECLDRNEWRTADG